jgi:predicted nucleic acid-binding Zn ribbon protein
MVINALPSNKKCPVCGQIIFLDIQTSDGTQVCSYECALGWEKK